MLEFTVIVFLCSSFPPTEEHCIVPVKYVAQFKNESHCLALAEILASVVPVSVNYPLKAWACSYTGKEL